MTLGSVKCEACGSELLNAAPDMAASAMKAMQRRQALAAALKVPEVKALMEAAHDRIHYWVSDDDYCSCGACEQLIAILRAMEGRDG